MTVLNVARVVGCTLALLVCGLTQAGETPPATVCNVKVLSDKVQDVSSLEAWKNSFIKEGMSGHDKAMAVWKSVAAFQYQDTPSPVEFIHHENNVYDPIKMFNVYGYGICCYTAAHVVACGRYAGLKGRGWGINNHSVCELGYDDSWHLIDSSLVTVFPKEDGKLASIEELTNGIKAWLKEHPELCDPKGFPIDAKVRKFQQGDNNTAWKVNGPPIISRSPSYDKFGWWPAGTHGWYATVQEYDGRGGGAGNTSFVYEYGASVGYQVNLQLRAGEKIIRNWSNKGLHVQMDVSKSAPDSIRNPGQFFKKAENWMGAYDPVLKSLANERIGNGTHEYDVPLASAELKHSALLYENLVSKADDNSGSALHVKDEAKPGMCVIRMPSSYVYLSGTVSGKAVVGNGGSIAVEYSRNNGLDWTEVQKITQSGDLNIDLKNLVYRRYDYRLRFSFNGKGTGLDALKFSHDIQHSQRALPALDAGENKISFSAGAQESTVTIEANSFLGKHKDKQIEYTEYKPKLEGFAPDRLKLEGAREGTLTVPIETPGEMTRVRLWAHYRTWGDEDSLEFQVSFDDGKTFKKAGDGPPQKFGRTASCSIDAPSGTKRALVRYVGKRKTSMMIWAFRADADYKDPSFGFRPVKVTYEWEENGQAKKDEHVATKAEESYTIKCGAAPKMKSICLELAN